MEFNNNKGEEKEFPYEITWVDEETNKDLLDKFKGESVGQEKCLIEINYKLLLMITRREDRIRAGGRGQVVLPFAVHGHGQALLQLSESP